MVHIFSVFLLILGLFSVGFFPLEIFLPMPLPLCQSMSLVGPGRLMQMLGKLGGKTKLIFYIFCPPPCSKNVPAPLLSALPTLAHCTLLCSILFKSTVEISFDLDQFPIFVFCLVCRICLEVVLLLKIQPSKRPNG